MKKYITLLFAFLVLITTHVVGQSIGINTTNPDSSAALDISASDKGLLIPRLDSAQRASIINPANGLMVYDSITKSFWFHDSIWIELSSSNKDLWFKKGSVLPATQIDTAIYFAGDVAIGKDTGFATLNIYSDNDLGIAIHHESEGKFLPIGLNIKMDDLDAFQQFGLRTELSGDANSRIGNYIKSNGNDSLTSFVVGNWSDLSYSTTISDSTIRQLIGSYNIVRGYDNIYLNGTRNDVGGSSYGIIRGTRNEMNGTGSGEQIGTSNEFGSSSGTGVRIGTKNAMMSNSTMYGTYQEFSATFSDSNIYALYNDLNLSSFDGSVHGMYNEIDFNNNDSAQYAIYNEMTGTSNDGTHFGTYSELNSSGSGERYGAYHKVSGSGTGKQYGTYNLIDNSGSNFHYGTLNTLSGVGTGPQIGTFQFITNTGLGTHTGTQNTLSGTGDGTQYGVRTSIVTSGDGLHYGAYNSISGGGSGDHYGSLTTMNGGGTGIQYGDLVEITNTANNFHYGEHISLSGSGTGSHYGSRIDLSGSGTGAQYGNYIDISNNGGATHYGNSNNLSGSGNGKQYGVYNIISNSGTNSHYGVYNELKGTGTGIQIGSYQVISNTGSGNHFGNYNLLSGGGTGSMYGAYNVVTASGNGTHYGTYNRTSGAGTGTHIAGYFDATGGGTNLYAAVFQNGKVVANESGGDNDFRIESDNHQHMFFVDASLNRIGIKATAPEKELDVRGSALIERNSGSSTPQLTLRENGIDYSRLTFLNDQVDTSYWTAAARVNNTDASSRFNVYYNQSGNVMSLHGDGDAVFQNRLLVGVQNGEPEAKLHAKSTDGTALFMLENNSTELMKITASGNIAIGGAPSGSLPNTVYVPTKLSLGVANPFYRFSLPNSNVEGIGLAIAKNWLDYSDSRVKRNVVESKYGLKEVMALRPVQYDHHSSTFENNGLTVKEDYSKAVGFIAQEVYQIIKEVAKKPADEDKQLWSMDYAKLTPVLVKAIQQQQKIIESLQAQLEANSAWQASFQSQLEALKQSRDN
jgi:hypothetical protein